MADKLRDLLSAAFEVIEHYRLGDPFAPEDGFVRDGIAEALTETQDDRCPECEGRGTVPKYPLTAPRTCPSCNGTGKKPPRYRTVE